MITATISLTKDQWESIIYDVMNDATMFDTGLCAQAGREAVNRVISNALEIANKVNDATGVNVDLSEWKFTYDR